MFSVTVVFVMVMGYSTVAADMSQVSTLRVATHESLTAEEYRVVSRRKGSPVESSLIVKLIANITPELLAKSRGTVVEEQLYVMPAPGAFPSHMPLQ